MLKREEDGRVQSKEVGQDGMAWRASPFPANHVLALLSTATRVNYISQFCLITPIISP